LLFEVSLEQGIFKAGLRKQFVDFYISPPPSRSFILPEFRACCALPSNPAFIGDPQNSEYKKDSLLINFFSTFYLKCHWNSQISRVFFEFTIWSPLMRRRNYSLVCKLFWSDRPSSVQVRPLCHCMHSQSRTCPWRIQRQGTWLEGQADPGLLF